MKRRKALMHAALYTLLILMAVVWMFPLYWIIRTAFMEFGQIRKYPPVFFPLPIVFTNFTEGLGALPFDRYYLNTLIITVSCVVGVVFTGSLSSFAFSRLRWPGRDKVFSLLLTSMMLPSAVTLVPTFIGWSKIGGVDTFLPLTVPAWFGGGAFSIFLLRQFFMCVPREYDEAAYVDGANYFTIYARVLMPCIKPALISVAMFAFINAWNDFLLPLVYLNDANKFTISVGLRTFMGMYNSEWGYMMAATVVAVAPVVVVFFIGQKYIVEGVVMTGLKA
jgi:multiple sugar transport system permease protein